MVDSFPFWTCKGFMLPSSDQTMYDDCLRWRGQPFRCVFYQELSKARCPGAATVVHRVDVRGMDLSDGQQPAGPRASLEDSPRSPPSPKNTLHLKP